MEKKRGELVGTFGGKGWSGVRCASLGACHCHVKGGKSGLYYRESEVIQVTKWYIYHLYVHLIVPDSIHPKARLFHITMSYPAKELIFPPVNLQPTLLIISQGKPFIAPKAWADCV